MLPPSRLLPPPGTNPVTAAMIAERQLAWTHELEAHLGPVGGVKAVATTATLPFGSDRDGVLYIGVQGDSVDPDHPLVSRAHRVNERFFDAMGIRVVAGRDFTADDRASTMPVAIVNRTFVRRYLGYTRSADHKIHGGLSRCARCARLHGRRRRRGCEIRLARASRRPRVLHPGRSVAVFRAGRGHRDESRRSLEHRGAGPSGGEVDGSSASHCAAAHSAISYLPRCDASASA